jgi:ABC-type bacteriocin/lantibiotic exporter with double-glycine peptidase domain
MVLSLFYKFRYLELISSSFRAKIIKLTFVILILTILEMVSISVILPIFHLFNDDFFLDNFNNFSEKYLNSYFYLTEKKDVLFLFILLFIIIFILRTFVNFLAIRLQLNLIKKLRLHFITLLFDIYSSKDFFLLSNINSGKVINDLENEVSNYCDKYIYSFLNILTDLFILGGMFILLILTQSLISLIIFFLLALAVYIFFYFGRYKIANLSNERQKLDYQKVQSLINIFKGIKDIKIFNKENYFFNNFRSQTEKAQNVNFKIFYLQLIPRPLIELFSAILISTYFFVGIFIFNSLSELILGVVMILTISFRSLPIVSRLIYSMINLNYSIPSARILNDEINNYKKNYSNFSNQKLAFLIPEKCIEINNLNYWTEPKKNILENINLNLLIKEKICIIGESGSGKSTFLNILMGLLAPKSGCIIIDKKNQLEFRKKILRVNYLSQDNFTINDSIKENIAFGSDNIDQIRIDNSLKFSGLYEHVSNLKFRSDALLSELGNNLSTGEKQRIALARTYYFKERSKVLICDEPLNAVDPELKNILFERIFKEFSDHLILMVLHDLNYKKYFDKTYLLKDKKFILV